MITNFKGQQKDEGNNEGNDAQKKHKWWCSKELNNATITNGNGKVKGTTTRAMQITPEKDGVIAE